MLAALPSPGTPFVGQCVRDRDELGRISALIWVKTLQLLLHSKDIPGGDNCKEAWDLLELPLFAMSSLSPSN